MGVKERKDLSEGEKIKIQKEGGKEGEISVLPKTLPQEGKKSVWSWLEEFTIEWSETLITKKERKSRSLKLLQQKQKATR